MELGSVAEWFAGLITLAVFGFAVFEYWRSHSSKDAKTKATMAAKSAERSESRLDVQTATLNEISDATRKHSDTAEEIVEAIKGLHENPAEKLTIEHKRGIMYVLRNNSDVTFECEQIRNLDKFMRIKGLDAPFTIGPRESCEFAAPGSLQRPIPSELILDEVGADAPVVIPIPPK